MSLLFDGPWYRFPARLVCVVFGHAQSRQAHHVKPYKGDDWHQIPAGDTVLICARCHTPTYMAPPVTRWIES